MAFHRLINFLTCPSYVQSAFDPYVCVVQGVPYSGHFKFNCSILVVGIFNHVPVFAKHPHCCETRSHYYSVFFPEKDVLILTRGYELPRLNERFVYLLFFSGFTSVTFTILQKWFHRGLLPYHSVSVIVLLIDQEI